MSSYEEFLWKFFFRKVHMILNIFIFYHSFISLIVLKLSYIEKSPQKPFFTLKSLKNITFRVSGINSSGGDQKKNMCMQTYKTDVPVTLRINLVFKHL